MKRRIRKNIFGNWVGYEGNRKVQEFVHDAEREAREWLDREAEPVRITSSRVSLQFEKVANFKSKLEEFLAQNGAKLEHGQFRVAGETVTFES